jgi:hypothetical protein
MKQTRSANASVARPSLLILVLGGPSSDSSRQVNEAE